MAREKIIDSYSLNVDDIVVDVTIAMMEEEPVPIYSISITNISDTTKIILEKIRDEFVTEDTKVFSEEINTQNIQDQFRDKILKLLVKYFPNAVRFDIPRISVQKPVCRSDDMVRGKTLDVF